MNTYINDAIDYHIRTYRNILKQAKEVKISQLIDSHIAMRSILHEQGDRQDVVDTSAFIYSILRLPSCISHVSTILLGQSLTVFKKHGFDHVEEWQEVTAPGRRRKMFYDGENTLAVYIGSVSDVDDMVALLTAYQIEWNKFHHLLLKNESASIISEEDQKKLTIIVQNNYEQFLYAIKQRMLDYKIVLLSGSYVEYFRTTQMWWHHVRNESKIYPIEEKPIYFVSSNMHAIANIVTRTAVNKEEELLRFIQQRDDLLLKEKVQEVYEDHSPHDKEFFLYYVGKKYERENESYREQKKNDEIACGIQTIFSAHHIDVPAQIIEIKNIAGRSFHANSQIDTTILQKSDAIIVNIDYPLGWLAYQILSEIAQNVEYLLGVYIMGKAAILHGNIGDIVLPTEVYDEHTKNLFTFPNGFTVNQVKQWYKTGSVFSGQKNRTVKGTFFQNASSIQEWYREQYTAIEMEAGPYLNAISECMFYHRYPEHKVVHLSELPFDFAMAHYASDTPNSKAKNLGVRNLSYDGVACTYGIAMTILERIIEQETKRLTS